MIRTWALFAVLISGALIGLARGGDRVECEPQRVTGDGHYWAYRIIDGRECWYPGRPGKPKNELYWGRGTTPSARQTVDQPEAEAETETVPSEPPSRLVAAPPEKPQIAEAMPVEWRATAADQLLAFTCCWPELEEPAQPPAWPLALLPLGLYALWWIAKPRRGLRSVRAGDAGRVVARSLTRLHRHNGHDGVRERRAVSAMGWCENVQASGETTNTCRPAAEQRDELAPLHSITSSARSRIEVGSSMPIALAVLVLMTSSNLVGNSTGRSAAGVLFSIL